MSPQSDIVAKIVERNLGVYRADPGRLREDVNQEAEIAEDYRGRLLYELLQNADDAMQGQATHDDSVAFLVTDDALWMANTGRPLTDDDVVGLSGLGASSKTDSHGVRRASIGHKGLGFKSVLEITDRPAAYSTTYCFELGEPHARPHVDGLWRELGATAPKRLPAMRFPTPLNDEPASWRVYRDNGYHTGFRFPFRAAIDHDKRRALGEQLLHLPLTTVLFLKHLEHIDVRVEQQGRSLEERWTVTRQRRADATWQDCTGMTESGLYHVTVRSTSDALTFLVSHDADVPIGQHRLGLKGPAWEGVDLTEVSVAVLDPAAQKAQLDVAARRFHVFLPTEQPCSYPMLVNGAFSTDVSRQRIKVTADQGDYNAHLVRTAATIFRNRLVPELMAHGAESVLDCLDRSEVGPDDTMELLHAALTAELADVPFIPNEGGGLLRLPDTVVPPVTLGERGVRYRATLPEDAQWNGRHLPMPAYCAGRPGRIAIAHGAQELAVDEAVEVLGTIADPARARLVDHESGGFALDPVLEQCVALWQTAAPEGRRAVEKAARTQAVFPVRRLGDGAVDRVALDGATAFYPSRAAKHELPLAGLQFLCHDVCWGALTPKERNDLLGDRMLAWAGLFDIRDFDFEEVMRAAVIPALRLDPDKEAVELREGLQNIDALAAICQLAGKRPKPDRPLRYQRLGSDRALFNLARLRVPCRTIEGQERWEPAYRVYFDQDWVGTDSVERIMEGLPEESPGREHVDRIVYLAPPERFLGTLDLPRGDHEPAEAPDEDDDEVDLDEDADTPLETDERERWTAFLSWIGVNRALRPVHFHDVEERGSGWISTKGLTRPEGWAFANLGTTWTDFRAHLEQLLRSRPDADAVDPYLYEAHDLEFIVPLVRAASQDASGKVGSRLLEHLTRHWRFYEEFADAELALVGAGKWPTHRTKPARAMPEERVRAGDNLWLFRLRRSSFCPTTHGPREPSQTWLSTPEAHRRFGQRGRAAGDFLPLLELEDVDPQRLQTVARRLGIRIELAPATFTLADARLLTERLAVLYGDDDGAATIPAQAMSRVVRPVYREMFELLSGRSDPIGDSPPLESAPLVVEEGVHLRFVQASSALYARGPGMKERSGVADLLPIFVLEAHPAANAPLARLFGVRALDDELNWQPAPGESGLDPDELDIFRQRLRSVLPALLARIRAERSEPRDRRLLAEFVERIEPVEELALSCSLGGTATPLRRFTDRQYFVAPPTEAHPLQAFVVWDGAPWPPRPEQQHAMAMAMADLLGLNLVEAFLAFLGTDDAGRRRLLSSAGASGHLADILAGEFETEPDDAGIEETTRTVNRPSPDQYSEVPATPVVGGDPKPAAPRIPLLDFGSLLIDGVPLLITGVPAAGDPGKPGGPSGASESKSGHGTAGAAPGVDLQALDALGMRIAATYELRRLQRAGHDCAVLGFDQPADSTVASLVVDVSTPAAIRRAEDDPIAKQVLLHLEQNGVSRIHPGFDLLTITEGQADRLIELKSSAVDARVQAMSWNEWKSARNSHVRKLFWLHLVGNLRADLPNAIPYVRAIHDPFGTLVGEEVRQEQVRRAVQLRVREFKTAEHLDLTLLDGSKDGAP